MAFKFLVFAAFVAVAKAGNIGAPLYAPAPLAAPLGVRVASPLAYAAPIAKTVISTYNSSPAYSYSYNIQDPLTGDSKNQQETRQGDVVIGSYSLTEPDGTRRIVEYTADPLRGFNAVVRREPLAIAKTVVAAPVIAKVAAPIGYAAPIARAPLAVSAPLGYAAPIARAPLPVSAPLGYAAPVASAPLAVATSGYARLAAPALLG